MWKRALIIPLSLAILIGTTAGSWAGVIPAGGPGGRYTLIAWNDLGMHCIDHDYSVFAILPPYNNLHAQLIDRSTGRLVDRGVTLFYMACEDTHHSINTTSWQKTDFWDYVEDLFGVDLPHDIGLTGNPVPGRFPAPMTYDMDSRVWIATGIPIVPEDNKGRENHYPMVRVIAFDSTGKFIAVTKTVLPVSDEMACSKCHSSDVGDPAARPSPDWVRDPEEKKDWKRNILLLHDNRNQANPLYATALAASGYSPNGLLATSDSGHPILCARCHPSNALGTAGVAGVKQLTTSMHSWHAVHAMDDNTGMPLGETMDRSACYYCHPGSETKCLRGVMGNAKNEDGSLKLECQSCHGPMAKVGADGRAGWIDLPRCQNCHYRSDGGSYVQDTTAFDAAGNFRNATSIFSTGASLYKAASTHGGVQCEACHGSTHAEYESSERNDNLESLLIQKYTGVVAECSACHTVRMPPTDDEGPHGLHTVGKAYLLEHDSAARRNPEACAVCHGKDFMGTRLSRTFTKRKLFDEHRKRVIYTKGEEVGCFDCHEHGPDGH